jgi:monoamine oxidase
MFLFIRNRIMSSFLITQKYYLTFAALALLMIAIYQYQYTSPSQDGSRASKQTKQQKVLIVGAGPAGLYSGYLLAQKGIDFQILEATDTYGGRMKVARDFADFPIPLGAEWLHVNPSIFQDIVNDSSVIVDVETVGYQASDKIAYFENGKLTYESLQGYADRKFVGTSWLDFFEKYIVPKVKQKITYKSAVSKIDHTGEKVIVTSNTGEYVADKVIVTAPVKIIKDKRILFTPELSEIKRKALADVKFWPGIKIFIDFDTQFYPAITEVIDHTKDGEYVFYDASYGQKTSSHIMGILVTGEFASKYLSLQEDEFKDYVLSEIDAIFGTRSHTHYHKHIVQNWSAERYIGGAYAADDNTEDNMHILASPIDSKIYFAGEGYTRTDDWGGVHNVVDSVKSAVHGLLRE